MPCYELIVDEKPPTTPEERTERMILIFVAIIIVLMVLGELGGLKKSIIEIATEVAAASR